MGALGPIRVVDSSTIEAPRRRGPSLTRRTHQQGRVYQKGRKRTDPWLPKALALVQFYRDVPVEGRKHEALCLGVCRTRSIAERIAAEKLVELGINSTQTFIEACAPQEFNGWYRSLI